MVEAAIVFPLVIGAVIAVIYITLGLYSALSLQTSIHLSLRQETGVQSDTIERGQTVKAYEYQRKNSFGKHAVLLMKEQQVVKMKGLFRASVRRQENGSAYVIDEAELVRGKSAIKEVLNQE